MKFSPEQRFQEPEREVPPPPQASETEWGFFLLQDLEDALADGSLDRIKFCRDALSTFMGKMKDKRFQHDLQERWNDVEAETAARQARPEAA